MILEQALISLTNFAISALLARECSQHEYGSFVLAFSVLTFFGIFQSALVTGPMMVLGASLRGVDMQSYFRATAYLQILLALSLSLLVLAVLGIGVLCNLFGEGLRSTFVCLALVLPFVQGQEFFRRLLLTNMAVQRAMLTGVAWCALVVAGLFSLWTAGGGSWSSVAPGYLSANRALLCLGLASSVGCAVGYYFSKSFLAARSFDLRQESRKNWNLGKWLIGTQVGGLGLYQANLWVVGAIGGETAVANLDAPRLLVAPIQVLIFGSANFLTPYVSARFAQGGTKAVKSIISRIAPGWILFFLASVVVVGLFGESLLSRVFGNKYTGATTILWLWLSVYFAMALKQLPGIVLVAMRRTDIGMFIALSVGLFTMLLTFPLMMHGGEAWAIAARLTGEIFLIIALVFFAWRMISHANDLDLRKIMA